MCTALFLPVEGGLIQSQIRRSWSALSCPSETPRGGCRCHSAPDRFCSVAVTPAAYIWHTEAMRCSACVRKCGLQCTVHVIFKFLTWSSKRRRWGQGWCCRLWLRWREPCTGYCRPHNLKTNKQTNQKKSKEEFHVIFIGLSLMSWSEQHGQIRKGWLDGEAYLLTVIDSSIFLIFIGRDKLLFPLPPSNPALHPPFSLSLPACDRSHPLPESHISDVTLTSLQKLLRPKAALGL